MCGPGGQGRVCVEGLARAARELDEGHEVPEAESGRAAPKPRPSCPIRFFHGPTNQLQDFHPGSGTSRLAQSNCTKFYLSLCWGCHFIQLSGGYRRIHLSLQPFLLVLNASGILTTKQA